LILNDPIVKSNNQLVNITITITNTSDGEGFIFDQDIVFLEEVKSQLQTIDIKVPEHENDRQYLKTMYSTSMDCCKIFKGIRANPVMKIFMENFDESASKNFGCPFKKNQLYKVTNLTCTDKFLPPIPVEILFKYETTIKGLIKGRRGWTPLYSLEFFGRVKK
jgi:Protein of unknown function (DUF1091)